MAKRMQPQNFLNCSMLLLVGGSYGISFVVHVAAFSASAYSELQFLLEGQIEGFCTSANWCVSPVILPTAPCMVIVKILMVAEMVTKISFRG